jgi:hypothetical protein
MLLTGLVRRLHHDGGFASVELCPDGWETGTLSVLPGQCRVLRRDH